ncbi:hypothetical protein [Luteimicrobium album]|uniref:hypothetical protein n=1 Tax=Luteimicrobium album TaxID=1054550 RepID=UPI0024E15CEB|nr:hypothetical protein [Luteimicrobium album]
MTRLSTGPFGEIATYLPGRRNVPGIRLTPSELHVHVVIEATAAIREVAERVHEAVDLATSDPGRRGPGARTVVVHVDDLDVPTGRAARGTDGVRAVDELEEGD